MSMGSNLFYRSEMVNYLKANALDLITKELNSFAEDIFTPHYPQRGGREGTEEAP